MASGLAAHHVNVECQGLSMNVDIWSRSSYWAQVIPSGLYQQVRYTTGMQYQVGDDVRLILHCCQTKTLSTLSQAGNWVHRMHYYFAAPDRRGL